MREKEKYFNKKIDELSEEIKKLKKQIKDYTIPVKIKRTYISFEERKEKVLNVLKKYHPKPVNLITIVNEGNLKNFVVPIVLDDLLHHEVVKELYGSWKNSFLGEDERKHKVGRLFILSKK